MVKPANPQMNKLLPLILTGIGTVLLLIGLLFHFQHWPDMFFGIYSGPVLIVVGLILFLIKRLNDKSANP